MIKKIAISAVIFGAIAMLPLTAQDGVETALPGKLINTKGEPVSHDQLKGKVVGLYFSAHRCAPCRAFTPSLVKFYKDNKENDFEVVFVSFDNEASQKSHYISEMNMEWLTVDGNKADPHFKLAKQFGVSALPRLIVLGPDGKLITGDGKDDISADAAGALAKWKKKS